MTSVRIKCLYPSSTEHYIRNTPRENDRTTHFFTVKKGRNRTRVVPVTGSRNVYSGSRLMKVGRKSSALSASRTTRWRFTTNFHQSRTIVDISRSGNRYNTRPIPAFFTVKKFVVQSLSLGGVSYSNAPGLRYKHFMRTYGNGYKKKTGTFWLSVLERAPYVRAFSYS